MLVEIYGWNGCRKEFFCIKEVVRMFGITKKKSNIFVVATPIEGVCIPITAVSDEVFAQKMMGDGFAIKPTNNANKVVAPISGKLFHYLRVNMLLELRMRYEEYLYWSILV